MHTAAVKVSWNALERHSIAPQNPEKAFRGPKMSVSAPEQLFQGAMLQLQIV